MATIVITGGSGMVGTALTDSLTANGHFVIILSRATGNTAPLQESGRSNEQVQFAAWDIKKQTIQAGVIEKADYIIHLAGASVAQKRWTSKRKQEIADSRIQSAALLLKALRETKNSVKAVISASAIGWYGPDPAVPNPQPFTETDPADPSFLGATCRLWEASVDPISAMDKRLVKLRIGIVLSNKGGALAEFKKPLLAGIAAILGTGKQVVSWIHMDDLCRIVLHAIDNESVQGVYNAVAPQPVNNKELTLKMAKIVRGNWYLPVHVPALLLKWVLGEMSIEVLKSATVAADKIHKTGFTFLYPGIDAALNQLLKHAPDSEK